MNDQLFRWHFLPCTVHILLKDSSVKRGSKLVLLRTYVVLCHSNFQDQGCRSPHSVQWAQVAGGHASSTIATHHAYQNTFLNNNGNAQIDRLAKFCRSFTRHILYVLFPHSSYPHKTQSLAAAASGPIYSVVDGDLVARC